MFKRLTDELFWSSNFDFYWKVYSTSDFERLPVGRWNKLQMHRSFWRECGRRYGYSPERAVFEALREYADEAYKELKGNKYIDVEWREIALALDRARPSLDNSGRIIEREKLLADPWLSLVAEAEEVEDRQRNLMNIRFDESEVEAAWQRIVLGDVPDEARRIWHCASRIGTAYAISERAGVNIEVFVFWMLVFRAHGLMEEFKEHKANLYKNRNGDPDNADSRMVYGNLTHGPQL